MNYRHVYMLIIEHAKSEQLQGIRKRGNGEYYENHHILPKSLFPLWKNRKPNQVLLTAREHFFCHQLLTKIYPTKEMYSALSIFCKFKQNKRKLASRQYETCKKAASKASYLRWADSEFKTKVSISMKNAAALKDFSFMQTDEYKEIHRNISHNSKWYNDGINEYFVQIPQDGWILGRLKRSKEIIAKTAQKRKETRMNRSDDEKQKEYKNRSNASKEKHKRWKESGVNIYIKGNHWYNNGVISKKCFSCPQGWEEGRLILASKLKKIQCIETGEIFLLKDMMCAYKAAKGVHKTYNGFHWEII